MAYLVGKTLVAIGLVCALTACSGSEPGTTSGPDTVATPAVASGEPDPVVEVYGEGSLYESGEYVEYATFSPDGATVYFNKMTFGPVTGSLYESQLIDGVWSEPTVPSYAQGGTWESHSVVSFDGNRVLFNSRRDSGDDFYIWQAVRDEGGAWGEPTRLFKGFQPALTADGTLYLTRDPLKLYRAVWSEAEGIYAEPELIDGPFNDGAALAMSPYIAPDESYLIYSKNDMRMYVSYQVDGAWSTPTPLLYTNGDVVPGFAAYVSHDQQTLYTFDGEESTTMFATAMGSVDIELPYLSPPVRCDDIDSDIARTSVHRPVTLPSCPSQLVRMAKSARTVGPRIIHGRWGCP